MFKLKPWLVLVGVLLVFSWLLATNKDLGDFLKESVDVEADGEGAVSVVNGVDFDSAVIRINKSNYRPQAMLILTFTITEESVSTVDFEFQVSKDSGKTWAYFTKIEVAMENPDDDGVVTAVVFINLFGASHIQASKITNNDLLIDATDCNVSISIDTE